MARSSVVNQYLSIYNHAWNILRPFSVFLNKLVPAKTASNFDTQSQMFKSESFLQTWLFFFTWSRTCTQEQCLSGLLERKHFIRR